MAYGFVDKQSRFGTSRIQVDVLSEDNGRQGEQVTVDQSWPMQVGMRLSTSLAAGQETSGEHITRWSFAAYGGADRSNSLSFDGNVRWTSSREIATKPTASTPISASIGG